MIRDKETCSLLFYLFLISVFLLLSCPAMGQEQQKKELKEADYGKWGTLRTKDLSDHGNWVSFEMIYQNQKDTLFLKRTNGNETFTFLKGSNGSFGGETIFACQQPDNMLCTVELASGKTQLFSDVMQYEWLMEGRYLLTANKGQNERGLVKIRDQKGKRIDSIADVVDYKLNPLKNAAVFTCRNGNQNSIGIINFLDHSKRIIAQGTDVKFLQLTWQDNGKSVVYRSQSPAAVQTNVLQLYKIAEQRLFTLDAQTAAGFKEDFSIYDGFAVAIADRGDQVFFWVTSKQSPELEDNNSIVEIWNGTDKQLYPSLPKKTVVADIPKLACWYPLKKQFRLVSTNELPQKRLNPKQDYALLSNRFQYGLENQYYENVDYYLKNIFTGKEKLILEHQSHDPNQIVFSAFGNKMLYFRDQNWWVYDIDAESHRNITKNIHTKWDNAADVPHQLGVYGNSGWSADGKNVLLYDAFDIWCVAIDGSRCKRLTRGRELQMSFRIAPIEYADFKLGNYEGRNPFVFDLSKDLLLEARQYTDYTTGYYLLKNGSNVLKLMTAGSKITDLRKAKLKKGIYVCTEQRFDQSPKLMFISVDNPLPKTLFESNKQQKEYYYGRSELVSYCNSNGRLLKGALFYPAHYDAAKQYPMVVNIYDTMSKYVYDYVNPSLLNPEGFNSCNFTLNGYFVFFPDISYQLGDPGIAAVDCVVSGINAVIEKGIVEKNNIGLIGHSFGGYETDCIISRSSLFAAAVSGAGISDLAAYYFNLGQNSILMSDMWRMESQQWRMGKSFFADKEGYLRNSPIMHADKIKTPVLLWAGKNDRIVPIHQSESFYLALRRLRLKNIFLAYPGEGHSIANKSNQIDLTHRIQQWFDFFLKNETAQPWISKGIVFN
jgi:hypothetical protein